MRSRLIGIQGPAVLLTLMLALPARAATPAPPDLAKSLIVAGTPAVVRAVEWPFGNEAPACVRFFVHGSGVAVRGVYATTVGLGSADLAYSSPSQSSGCDASRAGGRKAILWLPLVDARGAWLDVRIPHETFPVGGSSADGKLRFSARGSAAYDVPVRLSTETAGTFWTAVLWFLGIAIPALLTALLAYGAFVLQERLKSQAAETAAFDSYVMKNANDLGDFFKIWYSSFIEKAPADGWRDELLRKLQTERILENLPRESGRRLMASIRGGARREISAELARVFPTWQSDMRDTKGG